MIRRMMLANFYSFRDRISIDLTVPETVPEAAYRLVSPTKGNSKRFPRVVGLYGPNASGKSTVLRAISFLSWFIGNSFSFPPNSPIPCYRFASDKYALSPIDIEFEFDAPAVLSEDREGGPTCPYLYKLILNGGESQPTQVEYEALFQFPPDGSRRVKLFERDRSGIQTGARAYGLQGIMKSLAKVLRPNVSVISTLAQLGHDRSETIQNFTQAVFSNIFHQIANFHDGTVAEKYLANDALLSGLNDYIARLDLGIAQVSIIKPSNDRSFPDVVYHHKGITSPLSISSESQGTRHFFRIFPMIFDALASGGVAVIDELDSSIHTLLLPEIIRWFWDAERNPKNAQLWFTCQNPYLLQELFKEEILFTEKDDTGASSAFSLGDVKFVRRDDNYMRKYLGGAYGALPHFG